MVDPTKITTELSTFRADFPLHVLESQKQAAKFFSDVSDLTSKTMRGILEAQTELLQFGAHQASRTFLLPKPGEEPGAVLCGYCRQAHDESDRAIKQARALSDVIRNYGWGLLELYADNYRKSLATAAQAAAASTQDS